jgi:hypothetical protein
MRTFLLVVLYSLMIMLIVGIVGLVRCQDKEVPKKESHKLSDFGYKAEIVTIDSCEYIFGPWGNGAVLTHKGNCKNPIHKK